MKKAGVIMWSLRSNEATSSLFWPWHLVPMGSSSDSESKLSSSIWRWVINVSTCVRKVLLSLSCFGEHTILMILRVLFRVFLFRKMALEMITCRNYI